MAWEDNLQLNKTIIYTYDNGGNILHVEEYEYCCDYDPDKLISQKNYTYGDSEWKDLLTNYNGIDITYDTIGNPLNWINGESFTWSGGRQLTGITKGNNVISYAYNDSGIRTSKTVNNVRTDYYLNGTAIIMQKTGDNVIWYTYDENGLVTGFRYNGAEYYYFRNAQSDIIGIVDSSGAVVANYTYDSWGNHIAITDGNGNNVANSPNHIANINPFRYRGYYFDSETGLYYLNSRYYDANVGRFLNCDNVISGSGDSVQGYNVFAYCMNNPVNMSDESGNWPQLLKNAIKLVSNTIKNIPSAITQITTSVKKSFSFANCISRSHVTTPELMMDLGPFIGEIGFTSTVTKQNEELGLIHSYSDIGNDESKAAIGANIYGIVGADIGFSDEGNIFVAGQLTPWFHGEGSLGFDGIGVVLGVDVGDTSYDFRIKVGPGLILIALMPQFANSPIMSTA